MPAQDAAADAQQGHPVDVYVGARLRIRRKLLRVSQENLADALKITFQQVQKYERGANRISSSKLFCAAEFLKTSVSYFFDGLEGAGGPAEGETSDADRASWAIREFLLTSEGFELAELFPKVPSGHRRAVLRLVKSMADEGSDAPAA